MPAVQTTYSVAHAVATEGMVANSEPTVIISKVAEDAEGIGFGKVCVQGDQDNTVTDAEAAKKFVGIAVLDPTQVGDIYAQNATVAVMKKGVIWVQASVAVAVNDPVYFVPATGVLTNVASSNTQIANASWDSSTAGAGLAKLRLA